MKINDSESRYNIVNTLDKNIFVDASAGSGKTSSLTKRMVALVESGVDVSKICTITFTKAAANEFFDRFNKLLYIRTFDIDKNCKSYDPLLGETTEISKERCRNALKRINLCFMGTIDSFTNMIVNEYPFNAKIQAGSTVTDKIERDLKIKEIYYRIFNKEFDNSNLKLSDLVKEFSYMYSRPQEVFVNGLNLVLDKKYAEIIYHKADFLNDDESADIKDFVNVFKKIYENNPKIVNDKAKYIYKNSYILLNYNKRYFSLFKKYIKGLRDLVIYEDELDENSNIGILSDYYKFIEESKKTKRAYYKFEEHFKKLYEKVNAYLLYKTFTLFKECKDIVSDELIKCGLLTFSDYLIILRDLLKEDISNGAKIIKHISNRFSYYYLDESQDTSPIQTEIFYYLASQNYTTDWKKCNPRPGSIFIVGDPKQSIYRFRGADIECYQETKSLFNNDNNEVYELSRNFRSSNAIKNWLNYKMQEIIKVDDGNPKFEPIEITQDDKTKLEAITTLNGVYRCPIEKEEKSSEELQAENNEMVASIINEIVNNDKYTILPQKSKKPRTIEYKDILIITKTKGFNNLLVELDKNNIPFYAEGRTAFNSCELLQDLKAIYLSLLNPRNKEMLYKALKSKCFNLSNNDLSTESYDKDNFYIKEEYNKNLLYSDNLNNALKDLSDIYKEIIKLNSYSSKFEYLMYNENIISYYDIKKLDLVYYALELIRNEEANGNLISAKNVVDFVLQINTENNDYERALKLNQEVNAVKVANVHKVKGLQAPICILSYQYSRGKSPDSILVNGKNPTFETYSFEKTSANKDSEEFKKEKKNSDAEMKRIEYVAATRAESVLMILYTEEKGKLQSSAWKELVDINDPIFEIPNIKNVNERNKKTLKTSDLIKKSKENSLINNELSYNKSYSIEKPSSIDKVIINRNVDDDDESFTLEKLDRASLGTQVHRLLELIVSSKNKYSLNDLISIIRREYQNIDESILTNVYKKINSNGYNQTNGVPSNLIQVVLNEAEDIFCEVPFTYKDGESIYHGIMDLVYKLDNKYYIIDYKTTSEDDDIKLENKYDRQLSIYKKAFEEIIGFDATANIYHIDL